MKSVAGWWKHTCGDYHQFNVHAPIDDFAFDPTLRKGYDWQHLKDTASYYLVPKDPDNPILSVQLNPGRYKVLSVYGVLEDAEGYARGWTAVSVTYRQTSSVWLRSFWKDTVLDRLRRPDPWPPRAFLFVDPSTKLNPSILKPFVPVER